MMPQRIDHKSILLADLLPALSGIDWARHQAVNSLALDSREVVDQGLWLALQGTRGHALEHLADALDHLRELAGRLPGGHHLRDELREGARHRADLVEQRFLSWPCGGHFRRVEDDTP